MTKKTETFLAKVKDLFTFHSDKEIFEFTTLSGLFGIAYLLLFLRINPKHIDDLLVKHEVKPVLFKTYVLCWLLLPLLGAATTYFVKKARTGYSSGERDLFYPMFIFWNFIFCVLASDTSSHWFYHGVVFTLLFLACQAAAYYSMRHFGKDLWARFHSDKLLYTGIVLAGLGWLALAHTADFPEYGMGWNNVNFIAFPLIILAAYAGLPLAQKKAPKTQAPSTLSKAKAVFFYTLAFCLIVFLVFDTRYGYYKSHYMPFLAPLSDLRGGKSLLYDVNTQYGFGIFYFLRAIFNFLPLDWMSLSFFLMVIQVITYFIFYYIVRQLFIGEVLPFFSLAVLFLINHFAQIDYYHYYPGSGPLRFGFLYILAALIILRNRMPEKRNFILGIECLVVAIAFFWSFDVLFYTVPAYLILVGYESLGIGPRAKFDTGLFLRRLGAIAALVLVFGLAAYAYIYSIIHELPHWSYYLAYIFACVNGFSMEGLHVPGYWWMIVGILYFSFFGFFALWMQRQRAGKPLPPHMNAMVFTACYGVMQFFYFLGRSNPNNVLHVAMPSILLVFYWLHYLRRSNPDSVPQVFKTWGFGLVVLTFAFYAQPLVSRAVTKVQEQVASPAVMLERTKAVLKDSTREDAYAQRAIALMKKYSGDQERLVYFLGNEGVNVALYGHILKVYPYNDWEQASICPPVLKRVMEFDPHLKVGDYIYYDLKQMNDVSFSWDNIPNFELDLLAGIKKQYELKTVQVDGDIVVAQVVKVRH